MSTGAIPARGAWTVDAAFRHCRELARHYENFPVGSLLVPREKRRDFYSIYSFARTADDYADEPGFDDGERLRLLDAWEDELDRAITGRSDHPIFIAVGDTIRRFGLPVQLFRDLLIAFRSDVTTKRYETFEDVLNYCRCSANPVGRLILRLFGHDDPYLDQRSDDICTALQLANFWQDLSIDLVKDRIYIPREDLRRFGYREEQFFAGTVNEPLSDLLRYQVERTRQLFLRGRPLCDSIRGRLAWELRAVWLGGMTILHKIERIRYDVLRQRPVITRSDKAKLILHLVTWSPSGRNGCS